MASAAEAERYRQLMRLEMYGKILRLETQPAYDLVVNNHKITRYRADFRYDVVMPGGWHRHVIEDIKGFVTPEFVIKAKLFDALVDTPLSIIKPGQIKGSRALYMAEHWDGKVPGKEGEPIIL